jgi:hypothetical protein
LVFSEKLPLDQWRGPPCAPFLEPFPNNEAGCFSVPFDRASIVRIALPRLDIPEKEKIMRRREFCTAIVLGLAALLPGQLFAQHAKKTQSSSTTTSGGDATAEDGDSGKPKKHQIKDGPIVIDWPLKFKHHKGAKGDANVTIDDKGNWSFSGQFVTIPDHDVDVVIGVTASDGSTYLFRYAGSITHGAQWQKQGQSPILADSFNAFKHHTWHGEYKTYLSKAGVAKDYEARQRKKMHLKKEELEKEEAKERQEVQMAAKAHQGQQQASGGSSSAPPAQSSGGSPPPAQSGSGGPSTFSQVLGTVTSTLGALGPLAGLF